MTSPVRHEQFLGHLSIRLPDGYIQYCVVRESHYALFLGRLYEILEIILQSGLNRPVRVNYKGDYAGAVPVFIKRLEDARTV